MAIEKKYLSLDKLKLYDDKIKAKVAADDAATLAAAKTYADGLGDNYDAAGSAATAESNAKAHANAQVDAEAKIARAAEQANATAAANAQTAADKAQAAADKTQGEVDALETYVGTLPEDAEASSVIAYIDEKAAEVLSQATGSSSESAASVKAALDAYKTENNAKVTANTENIAKNTTAIDEEVGRAKAAEEANAANIKKIADDYLKAADKTALTDSIATKTNKTDFDALKGDVDAFLKDADMTEAAKNTLKELQEYITSDETAAAAMLESIQKNTQDVSGLTERMGAAETNIGTKAAQTDLDTAVGRIDALETASATHATTAALTQATDELKAADAGQVKRIEALESKFGDGEGNVEAQIAKAKTEAISDAVAQAETKDIARLAEAKKYTDDEIDVVEAAITALQAASETHASATDVTALTERVTTAEGKVSTLETEMDAVEKKATDNATAIAGLQTSVAAKAEQTALDAAIARIAANETAIASFVEISESEINSLFA